MFRKKINPKFESLTSFLNEIPDIFDKSGETIYTGRNLIKVFNVGGLQINVKRYGVPFILNRIIYTFIRKPKGQRAFEYPFILQEKGINTPEPIAYIEERRFGLINYSYFVSVQSSYKPFLYKIENLEVDSIRDLTKSLAKFTADLHNKEIYHKDYSPGNILVHESEGKYDFCLVDINRMKFGPVSIERGCANFARLWGKTSFFKLLAEEYAKVRGADIDQCIELVLHHREKFWKGRARRSALKTKLKS